jgi:hypothetical protein
LFLSNWWFCFSPQTDKHTNKQKKKKSFEEDESGEGSSFDGDHGGREEEILRGVTVARVEDAHEHAERV